MDRALVEARAAASGARCRSAAVMSTAPTARCWRGGQPHARPTTTRPRMPRCSRSARRRELGVSAAGRLRSLRDAGAVPDVRHGHLLRPHPPGLFGASDPKGGGVTTGRASSPSRPAITGRKCMAASVKSRRRRCCAISSRRGDRPQLDELQHELVLRLRRIGRVLIAGILGLRRKSPSSSSLKPAASTSFAGTPLRCGAGCRTSEMPVPGRPEWSAMT